MTIDYLTEAQDPKSRMTADFIPPPLPEPCTTALVEGFQGSEYRSLSESWDETTARYSERRMRQRDAWWQARLREAVEAERAKQAGPQDISQDPPFSF